MVSRRPFFGQSRRSTSAFTLVEILTVIAIIGLLAASVIGYLQQSREQAENKQVTEEVDQYQNALEVYRNQNEVYPSLGGSEAVCLGNEISSCGPDNAYSDSSVFNDQIRDTISGLPSHDAEVVDEDGTTWRGSWYHCRTQEGGRCLSYEIHWVLENASLSDCGAAARRETRGDGVHCVAVGGDSVPRASDSDQISGADDEVLHGVLYQKRDREETDGDDPNEADGGGGTGGTGGSEPSVTLRANGAEDSVSAEIDDRIVLEWETANKPQTCSASTAFRDEAPGAPLSNVPFGDWVTVGEKNEKATSTDQTHRLILGTRAAGEYQFTLTCENDQGSADDQVTVDVANQRGGSPVLQRWYIKFSTMAMTNELQKEITEASDLVSKDMVDIGGDQEPGIHGYEQDWLTAWAWGRVERKWHPEAPDSDLGKGIAHNSTLVKKYAYNPDKYRHVIDTRSQIRNDPAVVQDLERTGKIKDMEPAADYIDMDNAWDTEQWYDLSVFQRIRLSDMKFREKLPGKMNISYRHLMGGTNRLKWDLLGGNTPEDKETWARRIKAAEGATDAVAANVYYSDIEEGWAETVAEYTTRNQYLVDLIENYAHKPSIAFLGTFESNNYYSTQEKAKNLTTEEYKGTINTLAIAGYDSATLFINPPTVETDGDDTNDADAIGNGFTVQDIANRMDYFVCTMEGVDNTSFDSCDEAFQ